MWCRRPEGAKVAAWRTGAYAVDVRLGNDGHGYHAFFDEKGKPVTDPKAIASIVNNPEWREVTVTLDEESYCPRCAHIRDRGGA